MGQVLHNCATTTHAVRAAIQRSQASVSELAGRFGINQKTVRKWRGRRSVEDLPMGPKKPAPAVSAPRHLPPAGHEDRGPGKEGIQILSDRLLPHRYRRAPHRGRQNLHVRRHRPHVEVRLRRAVREGREDERRKVPAPSDQGVPLQNPHGPDRQWRPVY